MFNPLHSITNQELFEKHLCNQSSHYEKYGRFPLQREAITRYCQIDTFHELDTKEDTGKSMKNALYILWYAKRPNSEPIPELLWSLLYYSVTLYFRYDNDGSHNS